MIVHLLILGLQLLLELNNLLLLLLNGDGLPIHLLVNGIQLLLQLINYSLLHIDLLLELSILPIERLIVDNLSLEMSQKESERLLN